MTTPPTPQPIRHECACEQPDEQRVLWIAVRRGLLTIVKAIEVKYDLADSDKGNRAA